MLPYGNGGAVVVVLTHAQGLFRAFVNEADVWKYGSVSKDRSVQSTRCQKNLLERVFSALRKPFRWL